jgi:CRP-like cAMP-binding protein
MPATLPAPPRQAAPPPAPPEGGTPDAAALSVAELVAEDQAENMPTVSPADLDACPAFAPLTNSQRREFLDLASRHHFEKGEIILHEGRETQSLWFILSGSCQVVKALPEGGSRVLATLEAGALFGEMSFFSPAPHSADVVATCDCVLLRLSAENWEVLEQIGLRPAFHIARHTASVMSDRLRRMDEWVTQELDRAADPADRARMTDEWNDFRSKLFGG